MGPTPHGPPPARSPLDPLQDVGSWSLIKSGSGSQHGCDLQPWFHQIHARNLKIKWMVAQTGPNPHGSSTALVAQGSLLGSMDQIHHLVGHGVPQPPTVNACHWRQASGLFVLHNCTAPQEETWANSSKEVIYFTIEIYKTHIRVPM